MILRLTQKLAKKIKVVPLLSVPSDLNLFLDWTANLFMASRWQIILLTNSRSLYSIVMPGKGLTNQKAFVERAIKSIREYMQLDGTLYLFETNFAPHADKIQFSKTNDRHVLGSMNDLINLAKVYLFELDLPLPLLTMRLNETPMSFLDHRNPKMALIALSKK